MVLKSDSLKALAPALVKAQRKMGAAIKDARNPFFKSKFADLNSVIEASVPVLNEENIAVLQNPMVKDNGKFVMQTILLHESGEYIASETEIVAAKSNDPQATGSAISYSRRYGLQSTITLRAEEDDAEGAMGRNKAQAGVQLPKATDLPKSPVGGVLTQAEVNNMSDGIKENSHVIPKKKVTFSKKAVSVTEDEL